MSFLDEFDKRAGQVPPVPGTHGSGSDDDHLLDFADLIRNRRALPSAAERERALQRVRIAEAALQRHKSTQRLWWAFAAAALLMFAVGLAALIQMFGTPGKPHPNLAAAHVSTNAIKPVEGDSTVE